MVSPYFLFKYFRITSVLSCFISVYVNHRPVFGLSSKELEDAFSNLGRKTKDGTVFIHRDTLLSVLQNKGGNFCVIYGKEGTRRDIPVCSIRIKCRQFQKPITLTLL